MNPATVLRAFKPNIAVAGFAAFLAVNAAGVWGGVFPFLPLKFQTSEILFWFSLAQSLVFAAGFFASVAGAYHHPSLARLFIVRLSSLPYLAGWVCLVAAMYLDRWALPLSIAGGALIGVGSAGFYMLWQRLFSAQDADTGNHNLILGMAYASLFYFALHLIPRAITVYLIPLVITPMFSLAISLKSKEIDLAQPMFEDIPFENAAVYRTALSSIMRPALCVGSLGLCSGLIRALAIEEPVVGSLVNALSMGSSLVAAVAFLVFWQFKSVHFNVMTLYRFVFPIITFALMLLPMMGTAYSQWLAAGLYAAYSVMIMLMMIQCAQLSRNNGINPVFLYGFFGGVVYALHDIGFLGGTFAGWIHVEGLSTFAIAALGSIYILGVVFFVAQGGFSAVGRKQSVPDVELVSLKEVRRASMPTAKERRHAAKTSQKPPEAKHTENEVFHDRISKQVAIVRQRFRLTARESEVMDHIVRGKTVVRIAEELVISENTVRMHSKRIYTKTGVHKKQELIDLVEAADPTEA